MARFNSNRFLANFFPDISGLCGLLSAYGFEAPQPATVEKWRSRDTVPGAWLPLVLGVLELERGEPVSMLPFIDQ
jgi:hypothetical protein